MENDSQKYPHSLAAFETVRQFFKENGWNASPVEGSYALRTLFMGQNGPLECIVQVYEDLDQLFCYAYAPIKVPDAFRLPVAEFLTRANYGLHIGNFEMDFEDGEVGYKSGLDFEGITVAPVLIKNALYPAVQTLDRHLPGLMAIIHDGRSATDAIDMVKEH